MRMEKAIKVESLVKKFQITQRKPGLSGAISSLIKPQKKTITALSDISFSIDEGELVGFIGPNGAGKTTTLKTLSGLLYPTQGYVNVNGFTPFERKVEFLKNISLVMGQKSQLWWDLPAMETFELNRAIYDLSDKTYQRNLNELVNILDVGSLLKTPVRRLSLGQRMRLELVASLLHHPKTIFMDEPTIGLDIVASQKLRDFIKDYNKKYKATILLTSHNMDDVFDLAKRVIVISKGSIIFDGIMDELVSRWAKEKIIKVAFSKDIDVKKLENIGTVVSLDMPKAVISVPRTAVALAASELLQDFPVYDLDITEEPIEEVIKRVFES
jgi:ABC-2 type transport system ATP-binding protein